MSIDPLRLAVGVASGVGPAFAMASRPTDREPDDYSDHPDYPREPTSMHTPHTPEALRMYDHLSPIEAILRAWTDAGPYPEWHAKMRAQVHNLMPVLAHNLERLEATSRG